MLTVKNIQATCDFYWRVPGMSDMTFGGSQKALPLANQRVNLA